MHFNISFAAVTPSPILKELSSAAQPVPSGVPALPSHSASASRGPRRAGRGSVSARPGPRLLARLRLRSSASRRSSLLPTRPPVLPCDLSQAVPSPTPSRAGPGPARSRPGDMTSDVSALARWAFRGPNPVCPAPLLVCACVRTWCECARV